MKILWPNPRLLSRFATTRRFTYLRIDFMEISSTILAKRQSRGGGELAPKPPLGYTTAAVGHSFYKMLSITITAL